MKARGLVRVGAQAQGGLMPAQAAVAMAVAVRWRWCRYRLRLPNRGRLRRDAGRTLKALCQQFFGCSHANSGQVDTFLDFLLAFVVREAVTKGFIQQEILNRNGELPVLGRTRAKAVGQGGVDFLLQGLHARVPVRLLHRYLEGPQYLELPVNLFDGALDRRLVASVKGWRCIFAVGHADS